MLNEYKDGSIWHDNLDEVSIRSDLLVSNRVLELLGENLQGMKILDIGCGNGKVARALAKRGAAVYAIDAIDQQIAVAQSIPSAVTFYVADMTQLDAIDIPKDFDMAISLMTFLYLDKKQFKLALQQVRGHVREGGRFIWASIHPSRYAEGAKVKAELPSVDGKTFKTSFYNHSMDFVLRAFKEVGFVINEMLEPLPSKDEIEKYSLLFTNEPQPSQYLIINSHT